MMNNRLICAVTFGLTLAVAGAVHAAGDAARGQTLSVDCADCHGADGKGDDESPKVVGLEEAYFVEQLQAYKSGAREDETESMAMYMEELTDQDMADLAAYYASLPAE